MNVIALESRTVAERISDALQRSYGDLRSAVKEIGRATFANDRTAENWWKGKCAPNAADLIELMRDSDEVFDEVLTLAGRGNLAELARIKSQVDDLHKTLETVRAA